MKKVMTLAALLMAVITGCAQQVGYTVNGSCPEGKKVYVVDRLTGNAVDSIVAQKGTFVLKGAAEKDALMGVTMEGSQWTVLFFNDGQPITLDLEKNTLKGSQLNEQLTAYDLQSSEAIEAVQAFEREANAALSRPMSKEEQQAELHKWQERADQVYANLGGIYTRIFSEHENSILPVAFLSDYLQMTDENVANELLDAKHPYMSHPYAQQLKQRRDAYQARLKAMEEAKQALMGKPFLDLEEAAPDGTMHKLSEWCGRGQWVLVDFWASWCGPCRAEMPNVVAAYEKYHAKGFDIVGVSFDQKHEAWVKAIEDLKMPWHHISDLKGWGNAASDLYNVKSIPASLLVDPEGKIVARDLRGEQLGQKLAEIFGE